MRHYLIYTISELSFLQLLQQFSQLKQKVSMQTRAASRHFDKRVGLQKICPHRRNLPQMTGWVTKK